MKYHIIHHIPSRLFVFFRGSGWYGNYKTWDEASRLTTGYDAENILIKAERTLLELKNASNKQAKQYPWELLLSLMWIAAQNKGKLNIIDFGGALGTAYYQNKIFFDQLERIRWNVVEQPHFVEYGKKKFETDILKFHMSVDDCISQNTEEIQGVLFGSVLQYLESPYDLLSDVLGKKFKYIVITRTGFTKSQSDRITIQKVPKNYYNASYPCWIFSEHKFMNFFNQYGYEPVYYFKDKYQLNLPSEYKGCLFKLKENENDIVTG
jgi:putative methyltransferase (TIGR04325 family)